MVKDRNSANRVLDRAMKSKGLQKLRWYCQVCEKQCRDENGFKCHTMTENHLRQMLVVGESAGKHISDYTSRFQAEFVALLSRRWGTKRVRINQVYQEYISDKTHLHMNATRFLSLTEFCKHLGRTGVAHVDETEKGWFITWIDNSPRALAKSEAESKKQRGDVDDETRQRKLIQEQIERAREEGEKRRRENAARLAAEQAGESTGSAEASGSGSGSGSAGEDDVAPSKELVRDEGAEKVSLNLSFKMPSASAPTSTSLPTVAPTPSATGFIAPIKTPSSLSFNPTPSTSTSTSGTFTPKPNPFKSNPLKAKSNPLKSGSSSSSSGNSVAGVKRAAPLSAMEAIVQEELAKKNRMMGGGGGGEPKRPRY